MNLLTNRPSTRSFLAYCMTGWMACLSGCATLPEAKNEEQSYDDFYQAEYQAYSKKIPANDSRMRNIQKCQGTDIEHARQTNANAAKVLDWKNRFSTGDRVSLSIQGDIYYSGDYIVNDQGKIALPHIPAIATAGLQPAAVEAKISNLLVEYGLYDYPPHVSLLLKEFGSVRVHVNGAVFEPGVYTLNMKKAEDLNPDRSKAIGDNGDGKRLSIALKSAAGIRPDANITQIELRRNGQSVFVDYSGMLEGKHFVDPVLISGDEVYIHSRNCFQEALATKGPITRTGIKVNVSNLITPAVTSIEIGQEEFPYGIKLLQAVISMNCVGGAYKTNARRHVTLLSTNPITGQSISINRSIEDLMRAANRDSFNPVILPGDSIACYDSRSTNINSMLGIFLQAVLAR